MGTPLYQRIADRIEEQVQKGVYRGGDRLPSVRAQSQRLGVSVSTVLQAYGVLQDRRLLESRPQSGYYVRQPATRPRTPATTRPPSTPTDVSISALAMQVVRANERPGTVQFGTALPYTGFTAVGRLHRIVARIARDRHRDSARYAFPPGDPDLRLQIARRSVDAGCSFGSDEVLITSGCQEALVLALRAVARAGDTVAIETPTFYGALQAIESLGIKALEIPTDPAGGISLEALQLAVEQWPVKALLLIPSYSNPLGHCMPDARKEALMKLLEQHDLPLIEDDIYADLTYDSHRPRAIKSWDRDGRVLLCSSVSKTLDAGLRIGWLAAGRYQERVEHLKLVSSMATATLPQMALAEYLESGGYDRHLREARALYRRNRERCLDLIGEHFPDGTLATHPGGGFLTWIQLPDGSDSMALHRAAMAVGISVAPGPLFSPTRKYRSFLRINYGQPWDRTSEAALARLGRLAREAAAGIDESQ